MPTYEYQCKKCGHFEIWQSIKDDALAACPTCGSKVERLISANVGFVLKGAGFYQNDYKNPPPAASRGKEPKKDTTGEAPSCDKCAGPDSCPNI